MINRGWFFFCLSLAISLISTELIGQPNLAKDPTRPIILLPDLNVSKYINEKEIPTEEVTYTLQSLIIGKGKRLALINDKFVKVGDRVNGAKVIKIEQNFVILSNQGRNIKIYLFEPRIRN